MKLLIGNSLWILLSHKFPKLENSLQHTYSNLSYKINILQWFSSNLIKDYTTYDVFSNTNRDYRLDVELTHEKKFSRFNLKNNRIFNHYRVIFDFNIRLIFMMLNVILPENFLNVYSEHSPAGRILYLTFLLLLSILSCLVNHTNNKIAFVLSVFASCNKLKKKI